MSKRKKSKRKSGFNLFVEFKMAELQMKGDPKDLIPYEVLDLLGTPWEELSVEEQNLLIKLKKRMKNTATAWKELSVEEKGEWIAKANAINEKLRFENFPDERFVITGGNGNPEICVKVPTSEEVNNIIRELKSSDNYLLRNVNTETDLVMNWCPRNLNVDLIGGSNGDDKAEEVHGFLNWCRGISASIIVALGIASIGGYYAASAWLMTVYPECGMGQRIFVSIQSLVTGARNICLEREQVLQNTTKWLAGLVTGLGIKNLRAVRDNWYRINCYVGEKIDVVCRCS